jgi:hypothetical protein
MSESASTSSFRLAANVAHEAFEDEHIVVNLESGKYYALRAEAADVWVLVLAGLDKAGIGAEMARAYSGEAADIGREVSAFLDLLVGEALLAPTPAAATPAAATTIPARHRAFSTPTFELHHDLQDLLLLDPIHEVDAAGWPVMQKEQSDDQN